MTSQQVMTYLTDQNSTTNPMSREEAHDLTAKLAQQAWDEKRNFTDVVLDCEAITSRLDTETIRKITDPLQYIGESKNIIDTVIGKYYQKKTL